MVLTCKKPNCFYRKTPYGVETDFCRKTIIENDETGTCQSFITEAEIAEQIVYDRARVLILEPDVDVFAVLGVTD